MIRNSHERPEGMDAGTLIMSGLKKDNVLNAIEIVIANNMFMKKREAVEDYKHNQVSKKILNVVISYIDYINRTVWYK